MTVAELIAKLRTLDPNAQVVSYVSAHDGDYQVIDGVNPCWVKIGDHGYIFDVPTRERPAGDGWTPAVEI